jgi:glutaredoxin 2
VTEVTERYEMSLLKQMKPTFKTRQEVEEYIKRKEESLQFWSTLKTVDMTELINDINKDIEEANALLLQI